MQQSGESLDNHLVAELFPLQVGVATSYINDSPSFLYPEETISVASASQKRRNEFAAGRACARRAMLQLNRPPCAIPSGVDRAPIWPDGLVGSITHSAGQCTAVVANHQDFKSIGIDMEPTNAAPKSISKLILRPDELAMLDNAHSMGGVDALTLYFCLKEAAYKAFYPLHRKFLDFQQMLIVLQLADREFVASPQIDGIHDNLTLQGSYGVWQKRVYAACWIVSR